VQSLRLDAETEARKAIKEAGENATTLVTTARRRAREIMLGTRETISSIDGKMSEFESTLDRMKELIEDPAYDVNGEHEGGQRRPKWLRST
jgi:vacuolar-type H+-ATPase subunit H